MAKKPKQTSINYRSLTLNIPAHSPISLGQWRKHSCALLTMHLAMLGEASASRMSTKIVSGAPSTVTASCIAKRVRLEGND